MECQRGDYASMGFYGTLCNLLLVLVYRICTSMAQTPFQEMTLPKFSWNYTMLIQRNPVIHTCTVTVQVLHLMRAHAMPMELEVQKACVMVQKWS